MIRPRRPRKESVSIPERRVLVVKPAVLQRIQCESTFWRS